MTNIIKKMIGEFIFCIRLKAHTDQQIMGQILIEQTPTRLLTRGLT